MKLIFTFLFQCLWLLPQVSFANNIVSADRVVSMTAKPLKAARVVKTTFQSKIKVCTKYEGEEKCDSFPKTSPFAFDGSKQSWNYFFNRCKNFDSLNNLNDIAQVAVITASLLVLMPNLGFVKTLGVETGLGYLGQYSYPSGVNKEVLDRSKKMVEYILQNKNKQLKVKTKHLIELNDILEVCSFDFEKEFINQKSRECLSGCHSIKR
jgi:hypothetical protein